MRPGAIISPAASRPQRSFTISSDEVTLDKSNEWGVELVMVSAAICTKVGVSTRNSKQKAD